MSKQFQLKRRILVTTALVSAALTGYGRRVYAACAHTSGTTYLCSGYNTYAQYINHDNATVTTAPGFGINVSGSGDNVAIRISGDGALSFIDTNNSSILQPSGPSGVNTGLYLISNGDAGGTAGSVTVNSNGTIQGYYTGIYARNLGSGALSITANGAVSGTDFDGINAYNSSNGTSLTIAIGAGSTVSGGSNGIQARNYGSGALSITANGDVTGNTNEGILAKNYGTNLSIFTGAASTISGSNGATNGIGAYNHGSGYLSITTNGAVTGGAGGSGVLTQNYSGTSSTIAIGASSMVSAGIYGIDAHNEGTDLTVTTAASSTVSGGSDGIYAINSGSGALAITINGVLNGNYDSLRAFNSGTDLTLQFGTTASATSGHGVYAKNYGSGVLSVTNNGNINATYGDAINVNNYGSNAIFVSGASSVDYGGLDGVDISNHGSGYLSIMADGQITGATGNGMGATSYGTDLTITTAVGSTVMGGTNGIEAYNKGTGVTTITVNGDVTGSSGDGMKVSNGKYYNGTHYHYGTNMTVVQNTTSHITGFTNGIEARNYGSGYLKITANGQVTGTNGDGIFAYNGTRNYPGAPSPQALTITTGVNSVISGGSNGIEINNTSMNFSYGTTITVNGSVTGVGGDGVTVRDNRYSDSITIVTGAASHIIGGNTGIYANNYSIYDSLSITANGVVTGTGAEGIDAIVSAAGDLNITTGANSVITGLNDGIYAHNSGGGALTITNAGDVTGATGIAIAGDSTSGGTITNQTTGTIEGTGGTAIYLGGLGGATNVVISGGHIIGDVVDSDPSAGFSHVQVAGNFVAQGGFDVSSIGVGSDTHNVSATFNHNITTTGGLTIGDGVNAGHADTDVAVFDTSGGGFTVAGTVNGSGHGDTANVTLAGNNNLTFSNAVGGVTALNTLVANQTGTTTFSSTLSVDQINIGSTGRLLFDGNVNTNGGTIDFAGHNGTVEFATGTTLTGSVTNSGSGAHGTVTFDGTGTVTGNLGSAGAELAAVNFDAGAGTVTVDGTINAASIGIGGAGTTVFDTSVAQDINFTADGTVTLSDGEGVAGHVDNTAGGTIGTLNIADTTTTPAIAEITGAVGATHALKAVNLTGNGTVQFDGNVNALSINDVSTGTLAFKGPVLTGGAINLETATATAAFTGTNAQLVNDTIAGSAAGDGKLIINNNAGVTFNSTLGAVNSLNSITIGVDGASSTATFTHAVSTTNGLQVGDGTVSGQADTDTAIFDTTAGNFAVAGTVNGSGNGDTSNVTVQGNNTLTANASWGAAVALSTVSVNDAGTLAFGAGDSLSTKNLNIGTAALLTAGNTITANGGTLTFGVTSTTQHGEIVIGNGATANLTGETVAVNVAAGNTLKAGDNILVIDGSGPLVGGPGATPVVITDNSLLLNFSAVAGTGTGVGGTADQLYLEVNQATTAPAVATTYNNAQAAQGLASAAGSSSPQLTAIQSNLNSASSAAAVNNILSSITPTVDGSAPIAAQNVSANTFDLEAVRLADLNEGDTTGSGDGTGMSAGDALAGVGMWGQAFGAHSQQDARDGIAGYDANTFGGAAGIDTRNLSDKAIIGIGVSYGNTQAKSHNTNATRTDTDSYQFSLYGDYDFAKDTYLNGLIGYSFNNVDTTRHDVGGLSRLTANATTNANQFSGQAELGRHYVVPTGKVATILTPNLLVSAINYQPNSYTEEGAGGADLHVQGKDLNLVQVGAGVKAGWEFKSPDASTLKPELSVGYRYAVVNDRLQDTVNFTGGGTSFQAQGPTPARSALNLGAALALQTTGNWTFSAAYNLELKSDYVANEATIRAAYRF